MHNNLIYLTDGRGKVDATEMSDTEWERLVEDNRDSTRRRLVKCAWCWDESYVTHWMKTYTRGGRVISHQPGESADHPYWELESDEHKAYCDRVERVGSDEGFSATREAVGGLTRSDVLLVGERSVSYEMQHSPFKAKYGPKERTRRALAAKRDAVAWHTDSEIIARGAKVAMLRSDVATLPQIENPRYELRILGGYRRVIVWTCTAREGHRCPERRFSGCSATHVDSEPTAITLDDFIRKAPASWALPVWPLDRQGFWTTPEGHQIWTDHFGDGANTGRAGARRPQKADGNGHSRRTAARNHESALAAVSLSSLAVAEAELMSLRHLAVTAHADLPGRIGEAYEAQWRAWRTAAENFQMAITAYAARNDVTTLRPEVERMVKSAMPYSDPTP
ncbi:hypothetical protein ACH4GK_33850 [Streptomyces rimosus]|uniref:hypothetical protein n=1 Tax=Streptomyces rimosus TaxID=1927 RepID=UPI000AB25A62|nr:hypothetical protein [Streptomyces rimosus]